MPHTQENLAPHAQVVVEQQVERPVDGAGRGVLHRQHAEIGLARTDRGKNALERMAG